MTSRGTTFLGVASRPRPAGFTLIELLVVMFIMSVVAGLVVGVSWYVIEQGRKSETSANQKTLIEAINAYRKATGSVPNIDYGPSLANSDTAVPPRYSDRARLMQALLQTLWGNNRPSTYSGGSTGVQDRNGAVYKATRPFLGEDDGGRLVSDAYGNYMIYLKDRGFGGGPRIVSAGPDGKFGDELGLTNPAKYQSDNIYSDQ